VPQLNDVLLDDTIDAAVARLRRSVSGEAADQLADIAVSLIDLPGDELARTYANSIQIDRDAGGYGWFVDRTPLDDKEFVYAAATNEFLAWAGSRANQRVDLLSVLVHELGHALDFGHTDGKDWMEATIPLGTRRLPSGPAEQFSLGELRRTLSAAAVDDLFDTLGSRDPDHQPRKSWSPWQI
jgi:hypothetical protein